MTILHSGERRGDVRKAVSVPVIYCAGRCEGEARLSEISFSGAILECDAEIPALGARVALHVPTRMTHPLHGIVARRNAYGVALRFVHREAGGLEARGTIARKCRMTA